MKKVRKITNQALEEVLAWEDAMEDAKKNKLQEALKLKKKVEVEVIVIVRVITRTRTSDDSCNTRALGFGQVFQLYYFVYILFSTSYDGCCILE